jgi:hypothetical protein
MSTLGDVRGDLAAKLVFGAPPSEPSPHRHDSEAPMTLVMPASSRSNVRTLRQTSCRRVSR